MEQSQALSLLGIDSNVTLTGDVIEAAYAAKQKPLQMLVEKAPTGTLKAKYQTQLGQFQSARDTLLRSLSSSESKIDDSSPLASLSQTKLADLPSAQVRHSQFEEQAKVELGLQPGQVLANRYEIREQIGAGGMGAVYQAFDSNTQKDIALKVMLPSLLKNERARERFMDEARLSQQLTHPNIVNVFDVQQDGDFCFLTMELLEGQDLRSYMDNLKLSRQPMVSSEAVRIVTAICDGLIHAHEITVHRDIKPENIFLAADGKIKIMDFGIARVQSTSQRTQTGAAMGTAYYMAPEQLQGRADIDGRADQYALGVLLYEMLSGQVPAGRVESLHKLDKHISKKLSQVVDRLLSGLPEQRFESIKTLQEALQASNKRGALPTIALPNMTKLAAPAVGLACVLLLGGLLSTGAINLKNLLPMSQEEVAQRKAASAKLLGEIKNYQRRLEGGRRQLNSDLRDAARNDSEQEKYLEHWQTLTDNFLFSGSELTELEGELSAGEILLRDDSFDAAEQTLRQARDNYKRLWQQFSDAEHLLKASEQSQVAQKDWLKYKKEYKEEDLALTLQAQQSVAAAGSHQQTGEFSEALSQWQASELYWYEAVAAIQAYQQAENYYGGRKGESKDYKRAAVLFQQAAELGHVLGQAWCGYVYEHGLGVVKDATEAVAWYRKAAEQENTFAQFKLGVMYQSGRGVTKDDTEAVVWYRKAAEQGSARGQFSLGWMYDNGRGVTKDSVEAVAWYRKAAELGHAKAQTNLGFMYENGEGVTKDAAEAVAWYRKAAEQGHARAQTNLGIMYENGEGVTKEAAEAVAWYRKAAEQGSAQAQTNLGFMYENGEGVTKDAVEAVSWYRKAAEQGYAQAQYNLGIKYDNGEGVTKDAAEAVAWYRKAAEQGHANAQYSLGLMYDDGQGVTKDDVEAVAWYRKAAEQGNAFAQGHLGIKYEYGEGVTKDAAEAVAWYRKAAEQGNSIAQLSLGIMYAEGQGVTKDAVEAVAWYRKAAEQGYARAQSNLGVMYSNGRGVTKDEVKAMVWYRKAADQGHADAQYALGMINEAGEIVMTDVAEAVAWYRKAANQGNALAQEGLERLGAK
jgi:TPR repeat protein/serine/threonine protein kinase